MNRIWCTVFSIFIICSISMPCWAQNPMNWTHDEGDEGGPTPIVAILVFFALLWFFNGPGKDFAEEHPGITVATVLIVPVLAAILFP